MGLRAAACKHPGDSDFILKSGFHFKTVSYLSDASAMAPALNEPPLTQVQITLSTNADTVASPRQELFVVDQHHHNNNLVQTINKEASPKVSSPSSQPIYLQHPRISYSSNGYAKPSFQLAFIQQISTANGSAAPSTGLFPVQQHMDRNNQPANNSNDHLDTSHISHNDPVAINDHTNQSTSLLLHHHHHSIPDDLDLSDAHLDLQDVDESTNELINHTLGPDSSHSNDSTNNNNNMGLQKDYLKENTEMEQMLGELANTSDLDLLQVFKSLAPSGSDNLCDLASGLALFNDVDVMNIGLEDVTTPIKEPDTQDIRLEIKKRQTQMMRKCDFLMRRLRKLQTNSMKEHLNEEVNGLFQYSQKLLLRKDRESKTISTMQPINAENSQNKIAGASVKCLLDRLETVANDQQCVLKKTVGKYNDSVVATSMLTPSGRQRGALAPPASRMIPCFDSAFSGQLELAAGHLQTELKIVAEAIDSDATASSSGGDSGDEFNAYTKQQTAQQMQNPEMQSIENEKIWVFNGERMVRKYKTKKIKKQELERAKRAATRWARERASIASRWSWLLAQISDLDYRIRQHSELHHQIKKNKGAVVLQNNSPVPAILDTFDATCSQSVNGYRGMLPGNTVISKYNTSDMSGTGSPAFHSPASCSTPASNETASLETSGACRTRAFERGEFRKRKLLQTTNLHTISKKAAKQSTVKCGCQWPLYPCALCTGRPDPTAPRDLPDMLAPAERVGLLDNGFHPVISFPRDISQSVHIEAMLRQPDFQTKAFRSTSKAAIRGALALQKAFKKDDRINRKLAATLSPPTKKKYTPVSSKQKKKTKKSSYAATPPNNNKYKRSSSSSFGGQSGSSSAAASQLYQEQFEYSPNGTLLPRSKNTSPTPTNSYRATSDRRARSSYDIDNIVIPYSVAASTRVEVLKCKEIPTPKWRTVDDETIQSPPKIASKDPTETLEPTEESMNDCEDLTPETVQRRHEQALSEERKKFSTFLKFPWSTRSRANRRIDSRADSSGTNTPDPTSPAAKTPQHLGVDNEQPPLGHHSSHHSSVFDRSLNQIHENSIVTEVTKSDSRLGTPSNSANGTILYSSTRRRTVSQKRVSAGDIERNHSIDPADVPPYEHRDFPLTDELFDALVKMMPEDHHEIIDNCLQQLDTPRASTSNDLSDSSYYNKSENPQTICKTICDFENLIGASSVSTICGQYGPPDVGSHMLRDTDEETESIESGMLDEDQNDPDWCEDPPGRL